MNTGNVVQLTVHKGGLRAKLNTELEVGRMAERTLILMWLGELAGDLDKQGDGDGASALLVAADCLRLGDHHGGDWTCIDPTCWGCTRTREPQ